MKCPRCGHKCYIVRMKKGDQIVETWECSFCFSTFPKEDQKEV